MNPYSANFSCIAFIIPLEPSTINNMPSLYFNPRPMSLSKNWPIAVEFSVCEVVDHYKIFVTKQLGGIGAVPGSEVKEALEYIDKLAPPYSLAIGTSCRCHGLVNFFEVMLPNP